ncbi:MAG: hypothetical protein LC793_21150 [Thermomicrobia bacterium]|nr:hypothetical protein [Thermomicrobia bacterium]
MDEKEEQLLVLESLQERLRSLAKQCVKREERTNRQWLGVEFAFVIEDRHYTIEIKRDLDFEKAIQGMRVR